MNLLNLFSKSKIFLLFVICFTLFAVFPKTTLAFSTDQQSSQMTFERAVFKTDEMNLESFVFATLKAIRSSIAASIFCISCTNTERNNNPGMLGDAGQMMASLYSVPPVSSTQYLAYLGDKVGIIKPAYAQEQSMGFQMNLPILPVWAAMRDVAYGLSVILFVVMGFAIMFKVKIDPKTVITIQLALPKIIIGLLLITFSYAIAGLVMDFMYLLMLYVSNLFLGNPANNYSGIFSSIDTKVQGVSFKSGWQNALMALNNQLKGTSLGNGPSQTLISMLIFVWMATSAAFLGAFLLGPIGMIFGIIAIILVVVAIFRLFLTIIKAYCQIIIGVVTAPIQILAGMLPGSGSVTGWLKNLISNALVFPASIFMLCLGMYLMISSVVQFYSKFMPTGDLFQLFFGWTGIPTLYKFTITTFTNPVDYFQTVSMFSLALAGLGIIMLAPNVSDLIQAYVTSKAFDYGRALGEATGPVGDYKKSWDKAGEKSRDDWVKEKRYGAPPVSDEKASARMQAQSLSGADPTTQAGQQTIDNTLKSFKYKK